MGSASDFRLSLLGRRRRTQRGVTLVEVLVILAVLGILTGLLFPAVQAARERARNAQCASNLRQIGLAAQSHASARGTFPYTSTNYLTPGPSGLQPHAAISPHRHLLAAIDPVVYGKIDFKDTTGVLPWVAPYSLSPANQALLQTPVAVFRCPSDSGPPGSNNYRANLGPAPGIFPPSAGVAPGTEEPANGTGAFANGEAIPPADFRDGLSTTALFSERLVGDGTAATYTPYRDFFASPVPFYRGDDALKDCELYASAAPALHDSYVGFTWLVGGWHHTWYNHLAGPNSRIPDCASGGLGVLTADALSSARSFHPGGVNVLFADGAVKFLADTVDMAVWRAISTRKGKEHVDSP